MISLPVVNPAHVPPQAPRTAHRAKGLFDSHGRVIRDVRLSVTDRCNYRCIYCMDPDFRYMPKQELLSLDEYVTVARILAGLGARKIRITGGEPTLYAELDSLIQQIAALDVPDLSMTTNGSLVTAERARRWKSLGLGRLTLSLDSLRPDRVRAITRTKTSPETVVDAIRCARDAGLGPIKVNAVVMRGVNDDELADFADFARTHDVDMRLIEFMPLDSEHAWSRDKVFPASKMLERIAARHALERVGDDAPSSTSMNYRFADGAPGRIGLIAPVTRPFCGACSRLRITADGKVRPCLFSHDEWDLRAVLRQGGSDEDIIQFLTDATWTKQPGHGINAEDFHQPARTMSAIGG